MNNSISRNIAVIGLGYVGLPVAVTFGQQQRVIAFDKNIKRIKELQAGYDASKEVSSAALASSQLLLTNDPEALAQADFYIVAVPTPINKSKHPDLSALRDASATIGKYLQSKDIVVYESTVYPGATENDCAPVLAAASGLICGEDFTVGYSPERINPGDNEHRFENITKIVAGQDEKTLDIIAHVYGSVVTAGIYRAPDIKTAEAAKVIENTQRDINIALMNELAIIFDRMDIDTHEVLKAAGTKWNFLPFVPGLVGGHCIGVDPYYLTYQAQRYGYQPEVILSGRRINDYVGKHIAAQTIKQMIHKGYTIKGAKVAILGLTFKKNCPDLRNSKVVDIIRELNDYGIECLVHDPIADPTVAKELYDVELKPWDAIQNVDAIVLAVAHDQYRDYSVAEYHTKMDNHSIIIDVKNILNKRECQENGIQWWGL